jgi:hypothetical protein
MAAIIEFAQNPSARRRGNGASVFGAVGHALCVIMGKLMYSAT